MITIKATGLTRTFNGITAVNQLNFQVEEGEIFGLVGPDGAGKTTTIRLLTGILEPSAGEGWICGKHIIKESEQLKENIAYMPQHFGLYEDLSVIENINFYADIYNVPDKDKHQRIERLFKFSGLEPFQKRLARNLSGGMKQKLGLVCALIHTPKVLFLDEPTNGVDPVSRSDFWQILYQLLKEKVTILLSTSYLDEAERCKRVGLIHKGTFLMYDAPSEIKRRTNTSSMEEAFSSIIKEHEHK